MFVEFGYLSLRFPRLSRVPRIQFPVWFDAE